MKKALILILVSFMVMFLLPLLTVIFAAEAGMAICFILFYAVNPILSVVIGAFSGKKVNKLWYLPVVNAVLFLISTWVLFDMGEMAFVMYSGVYLLLGIISMIISSVIHRIKK